MGQQAMQGIQVNPRRVLPREPLGLLNTPSSQLKPEMLLILHGQNCFSKFSLIIRGDIQNGIATNLRDRCSPGGDNRTAQGHRLKRGQAKAFVAGWINQALCRFLLDGPTLDQKQLLFQLPRQLGKQSGSSPGAWAYPCIGFAYDDQTESSRRPLQKVHRMFPRERLCPSVGRSVQNTSSGALAGPKGCFIGRGRA